MGHQIWAAGGLCHLDDLMFHKKTARDVMHEQAHCHDEAASHQLPTAAAFWIIWIVSMEECSSFTQNFMQFRCSTHSAILNAAATQYTQQSLQPPLTSTVKPSLFTHVHSSPLSLAARWHQCHVNCSHYINNGWTFSGQIFYICVYIHTHTYNLVHLHVI